MIRNPKLSWSQQSVTVDQFLEQYKNKLPALVKISDENISSGRSWRSVNAIYRVHKYEKQPRILARDSKSRLISIPIEVPDMYQLIPTKGGSRRSSRSYGHNPRLLADIVGKEILPYTIKQHSEPSLRFHEGEEIIVGGKLGDLTVERIYGENFLLGNIISQGHMFPAVMVLPGLLDIRLHVGLGLANAGLKEWNDLQDVYNAFARELNYKGHDNYDVYVKPTNEPTPVYPIIPRSPSQAADIGSASVPLLPPRHLAADDFKSGNRFLVGHTQSVASIMDILDGEELGNESADWDMEERLSRAMMRESLKDKPQASVYPTFSSSRQESDAPPVAPRPPGTGMVRRRTTKRRIGNNNPPTYIEVIEVDPDGDRRLGSEPHHECIKSLDEVDKDLETLAVAEVCECLCLLRLSHVASLFEQHQIDGSLLKTLKMETLKETMNLSELECTKLQRFVHDGWRPNLTRRASSARHLEKQEISLLDDSEDTKL